MKLIDMSDYTPAARVYWCVLVAAGAAALAWALASAGASFDSGRWTQLAALAGLAVIVGAFPIRIPNTKILFGIGDVFVFLAVIFLGVPGAIVVAVAEMLAASSRVSRRASNWLISSATVAASTFVAGHVFYVVLRRTTGIDTGVLGASPVAFGQLLAPLLSTAFVHYFLNSWSLNGFLAFKRREPFWKFWRDNYVWTFPTFFVAALAAAFVHLALMNFDIFYIILGAGVLAATYATYKIYFERVNEKTREAAEMSRLHLATVEALATAIDAKDQTTHCHVRRVQIYAAGMSDLFHLADDEIRALHAGALLHDIGKLAVPDHILNKPGELTSSEFARMKIHTTVGAQILERVEFPYPVVPIVLHHHERWDGLGYPEGLRGIEIPITARILAVVDTFDSVREDRPYRPGMTREEASALLRRGAGTHFDPTVVEMFLLHLPRFEAQISEAGLDDPGFTREECDLRGLVSAGVATNRVGALHTDAEAPHITGSLAYPAPAQPAYLDQIRDAHREVFALYEIARTFGSSLDVQDVAAITVNKIGNVVPFDTCAVYLYDERSGHARVAHAAGRNADRLKDRTIRLGEGVTGFVLANRHPVTRFDPMVDFVGVDLAPDSDYKSVLALPLVRGEQLLGALAVYSIEADRYTDDHLRLLDTVTRLASDALANAVHHAEIESNAMTDALTGLPNARALYVRFEEEAARARRTRRPFQVVMLDLDEFKAVNDTFGHKTGDLLLREVGRVVQAQLREYDFLARYAGDEFVAIVQDVDEHGITEMRERIERAVCDFKLHVRTDRFARVGISVGTASFTTHGETLDQLLIAADTAMYRDKADHKRSRRDLEPDGIHIVADHVSSSIN